MRLASGYRTKSRPATPGIAASMRLRPEKRSLWVSGFRDLRRCRHTPTYAHTPTAKSVRLDRIPYETACKAAAGCCDSNLGNHPIPAAIECYLDLKAERKSPAEIVWTAYKKDLDAYQGA